MVEYQKKHSSGVAKAALATSAAVGGLALLNGTSGGNGLFGNVFGGGQQRASDVSAEISVALPLIAAYMGNHGCHGNHDGGYVTDKDMNLIREIGGKDSTIARLEAEKYADAAVAAATIPLANRICTLETAAAVNVARDQDFRRYVNAEFIHQPKARINDSIVVCHQCGCNNGTCTCCH